MGSVLRITASPGLRVAPSIALIQNYLVAGERKAREKPTFPGRPVDYRSARPGRRRAPGDRPVDGCRDQARWRAASSSVSVAVTSSLTVLRLHYSGLSFSARLVLLWKLTVAGPDRTEANMIRVIGGRNEW